MGNIGAEEYYEGFSDTELADIKSQPYQVGRRSFTVLELVAAWAAHVEKIDKDRAKPTSDPKVWGAYDLLAAMSMRSSLEKSMSQMPDSIRGKISFLTTEIDKQFVSITQPDEKNLVAEFEEADLSNRPWWWHRIPDSGPILDELSNQ
ncbi:hypothetical protein AB0J47_28190 [Nocardia sp. NPDC049737]|uniref:hypothetical protein n=1 Tax=Nocardia sp. NPDC049737 TaxID=3154358 RepID=UPI0034361782